MTTTLSDVQYVEDALAALEQCKTDADLTNWDDRWCSNEQYINLPESQVKRLEAAYDKRVRWVCGVGAGDGEAVGAPGLRSACLCTGPE